MTTGVSNTLSDSISLTIWKVESEPIRDINCFGRLSRDSGQTLVPAPPHIMTGRIFTFSCSLEMDANVASAKKLAPTGLSLNYPQLVSDRILRVGIGLDPQCILYVHPIFGFGHRAFRYRNSHRR